MDHKDHATQFTSVAAPEVNQELLRELEPLKQVCVKLQESVEEMECTRLEVEAQGQSVADTINLLFDRLVQIVERRRQELLNEAAGKVQCKVKKLSSEVKTLSLASAEVQSIVDYTEQCVKQGTSNEVMAMHRQVKRQIQLFHELHTNPVQDGQPLVDLDIGVEVKCEEDIQKLCESNTKIIQIPIDPTRCTVEGDGTRTADINKLAELTLTAQTLTNGKPATCSVSVDCYLKSLFNKFVIKADVEQLQPGKYCISYTAEFRGRHELSVLVNRQEILGSPFNIFVKIYPSHIDKPVRILYNSQLVCGIAVNSSRLIVAGQQKGDPIVFYKDDQLIQSICRHDLMLDDYIVVDVATDEEDCVYFTLFRSSTLVKIDKDGNIIVKVKSRQGTGNMGIAVVEEEVMVCPCEHRGTIFVYDRDLQYRREIVAQDMGEFRCICPDSESNLFVTDWEMGRVRVFSNNGEHLQSFAVIDDYNSALTKIRGIQVSGQFIYVRVDGLVSSKNVMIFTTDGAHITSIGNVGIDEGEFVRPYGVCIDQDGFVYISDITRIQVF